MLQVFLKLCLCVLKCYKHEMLYTLSVIRTEAQTERTEPEPQGSALADFTRRQRQHLYSVVCVDEVHAAFVESDPSTPVFCHPDILVTWQQPAPESD